MTETTRSSVTQTVLGNTVDDLTLLAADCLPVFAEPRLDFLFEQLERFFIATNELSIDHVVGYDQWERFDIGDVDERRVLPLEIAREETPLFEPLVVGEVVNELDSEVQIGRHRRFPGTCEPKATTYSTSGSGQTDEATLSSIAERPPLVVMCETTPG